MDARQELCNIFENMGLPYWVMHQMPFETAYPPTFCTYLCEDAPFAEHYDNAPHAVISTFAIGIYADDPATLEATEKGLVTRLFSAGWVMYGMGEDVQSDEISHTGRRITAHRIHYVESEE